MTSEGRSSTASTVSGIYRNILLVSHTHVFIYILLLL